MARTSILKFASLILFFGCQSNPDSPSTSPYKKSESFIDKLNEQAGCCFRTVKVNTYQGHGWVILRNQSGWYRAVNLDDFDEGLETEWEFFQANQVKVVPSNRYHGSFSDIYGNIYEEASSTSKDLEKQGHFIEQINIRHMAKNLSEKFGLSEKRSFEVSKSLYYFERIRNKRGLNFNDLNTLSQSFLGLPYNELQKSLQKVEDGQFDKMDDLIEKASMVNGIAPEDLKVLLKDFLI